MLKQELDRNGEDSIEVIMADLEKEFQEYKFRDYTLSNMILMKRGLHKHEVKVYEEKIFVKSMIDANSWMIAFPVFLFFAIGFLLNMFVFRKQGMDLTYPLVISVIILFFLLPVLLQFLPEFKHKNEEMHQQLSTFLSDR